MSKDVLEQFRGKPSASSTENTVRAGPKRGAYEAFRKSDKRQYRLKVRPRLRAWERITYYYLQRIAEDGVYGTQIGLVYSFAVVIIRGKNLQPVADAIDLECCDFVQQFDPDRWEKPSDPKAPFVERIDIYVQTEMVKASDALLAEIAEAEKKRSEALVGSGMPSS